MASTKEIMEVAETELDGDELLNTKLCRKDGETLLYVEADEKITNLLHTGNTRTSSSWGTDGDGNGYTFHNKTYYDNTVKDIMQPYYDDYGSSYATNGKGNVAFLRTEGIEDGVFFEINAPLTEENLRAIVQSLKEVVDDLKDTFLSDVAFISEVREVKVDKTVQTSFTGSESEEQD